MECLHNLPSQRLILKCLTIIQIKLEFGNVGFKGIGENWNTQRKTSWSKNENQQQTQPDITPSWGIQPRPHWREAFALNTAPSLLP